MFSVAPETIKLCDTLAVEQYNINELTLMKNAAAECFRLLKPIIKTGDRITVLCGKGNNGGDGYELCRILQKEWYNVCAVNVFDCEPATDTSLKVYKDYLSIGGTVYSADNAIGLLEESDVIIDAIFGVGFYGSIDENGTVGKIISICNNANKALRVSIDVPSGINSKDGSVSGTAFSAHYTITLAFYKTGSLSYPAREFCGKLLLGNIGIPKELEEILPKDAFIPDDSFIASVIKQRHPNTHKGTYGRLMMFCSSRYMTGAGILAANAALRSGIGLVNIVRDDETLKILQHHLTEPIFTPFDAEHENYDALLSYTKKASALLIGCGLGSADYDKKAVFSMIKTSLCPIILDADGINAINGNINILKEANQTMILTPHPLEFSRLIGTDTALIQQNRIKYATEFAKEYNCVIILKGASTVIASYDGSLAICSVGGPGLAKGGSGDVLAGLCASLRAQGLSAFDSAVCAVYLHAKAGDLLSDEISVSGFLPSDLPLAIAKLLP